MIQLTETTRSLSTAVTESMNTSTNKTPNKSIRLLAKHSLPHLQPEINRLREDSKPGPNKDSPKKSKSQAF